MRSLKIRTEPMRKDQPAGTSRNRRKSREYPRPQTPTKLRLSCVHVPMAPLETRLAHKLRLAIHEGNSTETRSNKKLKRAIRCVQQQGMSPVEVQRIINQFAETRHDLNQQLLQIRYQRKIFLICTVHTQNQLELKAKLMQLLKTYNAGFVHVLHMFQSCAIVEAIISMGTSADFGNFEGILARDAHSCRAKGVEMVDYETGAVHFKCDPEHLTDLLEAVAEKGYKVLHTEFGLRPKQMVKLEPNERKKYDRFLEGLKQLVDVIAICDNVIEDEPEPKSVKIEKSVKKHSAWF